MDGFRKFILRGNVVDLAVGVVIGAAFTAIVTALVADLITPIIAAIVGKPDFSELHFTIHKSTFSYGHFINAVVSFLLIASAVYFFVVLPVNTLMAKFKTERDPDEPTKDCAECLSAIPQAATRCAFCTVEQAA
jgi:large conductance mechanosensitive channel